MLGRSNLRGRSETGIISVSKTEVQGSNPCGPAILELHLDP